MHFIYLSQEETRPLLKDEKVIKNISINSEGTFSSSLEVLNDGLYNFIHLPEFQYLIINKGDSLVLRLNSLDFDESLVFSGAGASKNNYLIDVFLDHEKEENYIKSNYKLSKIKQLLIQKRKDIIFRIGRKQN